MLINHLPPVLENINEFKVIMSNGDVENGELSSSISYLENNQYFLDASEKGVLRYENMLTIYYKATETLEERKFRLFSRYNQQLPYTKTILERQLSALCGEKAYSLNINYDNLILTVKINLFAKAMFNEVAEYLENIMPLNIIIDLSLLYNQYQTLSNYTYAQLSVYTYNQLRNEVIK